MIPTEYQKNFFKSAVTLLIILSVFFGVKIATELRSYSTAGNQNANTITVSGHGEIKAIPDIANISFTISKDAKTVKDAQDGVATVEKSALDFLSTSNIDKADIQTTDSSFYPKYDYVYGQAGIVCPSYGCPPGKSVISGYTASESINVEVRNVDDTGKIMQGLGALAVTNLSGPNFTIDDQDSLKTEARGKAIDDAKAKAQALAQQLGVRLAGISSFSENGGSYPMPLMYNSKDAMATSAGVAPAPAQVPTGQNTISSDVSITYEIR